MRTSGLVCLCIAAVLPGFAAAETPNGPLDMIVVTATRTSEPLDLVPADISVVSGE